MSSKFFVKLLIGIVALLGVNMAMAANVSIPDTSEMKSRSFSDLQSQFKAFYEKEWGHTQPCRETALNRFSVCSNVLRNEGNSPFMLTNKSSSKVAVLIHGLNRVLP